jgi:protein O-GlcNAc transferase
MTTPADQRNQARRLLGEGKAVQALAVAHSAVDADPQDAESRLVLAGALRANGRADEALTWVERALEARPDYPQAYATRAQLRMAADAAGALADVERALALKPDLTSLWPLASALRATTGDLAGAAAAMETAAAQDPGNINYLIDLGERRRQAGDIAGAVDALRRATAAAPAMGTGWYNLAVALQEAGDPDAARQAYERALGADPALAEAHANLAGLLREEQRLDEAEASARRALALDPSLWAAHYTLGQVLKGRGSTAEGRVHLMRALELHPTVTTAIAARLVLPVIAESHEAMLQARADFEAGIAALGGQAGELDASGINVPSFYLAYQGLNDRPLMQALSAAIRRLAPGLNGTAPHIAGWRPPGPGRPIRLGILSEFLSSHTIGKLYRGLIRNLDRSRFELVLIHTARSKRDVFRDELDALCHRSIVLPPNLKAQRQAIAAEQLDALFYPDIGMAQAPYVLAYSRLAPVQMVSLGHPVTTGIDTIDYFISGASVEPPGAQDHYSETLIQLRRLPFVYDLPTLVPKDLDRSTFGLPPTGALYGCPQSLFKFHPDFDMVLAKIAQGDPAGTIVVVEGTDPAWTQLLRARWARTHPILLDRVRFIPRLSQTAFLALLDQIDVLLDPLHFGSGNTLYEAMASGVPVVTLPGAFVRGRAVAAAYRQMGISDAPIVERVEDYAPLALALGHDPARRAALRTASAAAAARELYADLSSVGEFEAFLEAAIAAAGEGRTLPSGWTPSPSLEDAQA